MTSLHALTELLIARMESHPEEFVEPYGREEYTPYGMSAAANHNRWWKAIETIDDHGTTADKEALGAKLGSLRMDQAHSWAMDELLNGEDRRKGEEERKKAELQRYSLQQAIMQQQAYVSKYAQSAGHGLLGSGYSTSIQPNTYDQLLGVTNTKPTK